MRSRDRKPRPRHELPRVLLTPTRGPGGRATLVVLGRDLAFDATDELPPR